MLRSIFPRRLPQCTCSFLSQRSFASSSSTLSSPPLTLGQKLAARRAAASGSSSAPLDSPTDFSIVPLTTPSLLKMTPLTKLVDTAIRTLAGKDPPPHHEMAKAFRIRNDGQPRLQYARNSENGAMELVEEKRQATKARSNGGNRIKKGPSASVPQDNSATRKLNSASDSNVCSGRLCLLFELHLTFDAP